VSKGSVRKRSQSHWHIIDTILMCLHLHAIGRPGDDRNVMETCCCRIIRQININVNCVDHVNYDLSLQVAERTAWRQNHYLCLNKAGLWVNVAAVTVSAVTCNGSLLHQKYGKWGSVRVWRRWHRILLSSIDGRFVATGCLPLKFFQI